VKGYDHDRRGETWREAHGWSKAAREDREKLTAERVRNREPGRFGKVNWNAYQHDQLYDMIMSADPATMSVRAGQWQSLAARIDATTGEVRDAMARVLGAWKGQAAVSSAESNSRLMRWAGDASETASTVAQSMATYTEAVERARKYMPEPAFATAERNFRDGYTVVGTGGPSTAILLKQLLSDGMVSHEQARARKAEAVAVMEAYEARSKDVHDAMPHFTDATPTTNDVADWKPAPDADTGHRPPRKVPPDSGPGDQDTGRSGAGPGSATGAAGFVDPLAGGATGTGSGSGYGGGSGSGYGGYGGGLGSLGSGGSDVIRNSPGFGALAGAGGLTGRGAVGGVTGGRAGGAGGAFGGMPFGHAPDEDDKEHRNKYDVGIDFLDDLPPAYPPVFGA
jgi:uncharacterized protein YukE